MHRKHQEERLAKDERSKMQKELDKVIATEMKEKEKKKTVSSCRVSQLPLISSVIDLGR